MRYENVAIPAGFARSSPFTNLCQDRHGRRPETS